MVEGGRVNQKTVIPAVETKMYYKIIVLPFIEEKNLQ